MKRAGGSAGSALATAEIMVGVVVAHTAAGGSLPDLPWLAGLTVLVHLATGLVLRGAASPRLMLGALGVGQLVLHEGLAWLAPPTHAHGHDGGSLGSMLLAHAACAAVTALVWSVRRRLTGQALRWLHVAAVPLPDAPGLPAGANAWTPPRLVWLTGAVLRGPPALRRA